MGSSVHRSRQRQAQRTRSYNFTKYLKYNPRDKAKRDEQLKGFNEHMQRVIKEHQTWTGVPESLKCKL
jgi:hypothetical protein